MADATTYNSEELEAVWQAFQMGQEPTCPVCSAPVTVELSEDAAERDVAVAEIYVSCTDCGRKGRDNPGEHTDTQAWVD